MKFVALFLATALIFSASAYEFEDFVGAFAAGFGNNNLGTELQACDTEVNAVPAAALNMFDALNTPDVDALANAVENFGNTFGEALRTCGKSFFETVNVFKTLQNQFANVTQATLFSNLLTHIDVISQDMVAVFDAVGAGNGALAGEKAAEFLRFLLTGNQNLASYVRVVRQLQEGPGAIVTDFFHAMMALEGFLTTANTTINADTFQSCFGDVLILGTQIPSVQDAAKQGMVPLFKALATFFTQLGTTGLDCGDFKDQVAEELGKDLPLLEDKTRLANGIKALYANLPQVLGLTSQIATAEQNNDFNGLGATLGQIYNIFRTGLTQ